MPVSTEELRPHLQAFDFPRLFVEGLGWDNYITKPFVVRVNERDYTLQPIAEKAGFAVYECDSSVDNDVPQYPVRRKIESEVAKRAFEHLIIFTDPGRKTQVWQWVRRESGKPAACREQVFRSGQSGEPILQRLQSVVFTLGDEAKGLVISDVTSRVRKAFDVEKVTKRFYDRFRTELTAFGKFIEGVAAQGDRDWYASLMLNRMMFVYFVQKQGFLDGNPEYLRTKLLEVQSRYGDGRFQQFYSEFLLKLFHEGLGQPEDQRNQELKALLGKVPFLNGGLFDVHDLERDNPDISIPDAAFERVFNFFDEYSWHLDERPGQKDNEINPDVLGYIFEKYVNQKQMGAYYTKEDITGYISRNTVIPFLFDAARKECPVAFGPDGGVWRLLRDDPDRYIYPAVGHGIAWNARDVQDPTRLEKAIELPGEIADGIKDVSKRGGWNKPAPDNYALPTETWREVVARRQRHTEVRSKLASGEVQEINDLITLNLDVEQFARDVISQSEGPELLRAFWHAMRDVSVLDPTCGSGAFLFAALNVLEPLYTACLEGMRGFLDDEERLKRRGPDYLRDFKDILQQVDKHPSERYFILKSIVLNNLYGVDIMEEAVEICKLRLFLKLVAQLETYDQIEPLPDIDFNIRAGNTLVGFTSLKAVRDAMTIMPDGQHRALFDDDRAMLELIEEEAHGVDWLAHEFRRQQTMLGGEVTPAHKQTLRSRLHSLAEELDRLLAAEYGIDPKKASSYDAWRASHRPFHWFVEFYGTMSRDGFDVVIGNPPYVEYRKVSAEYSIKGYETERCGDLYAFCTERAQTLLSELGRLGLIVPISFFGTDGFRSLQQMTLRTFGVLWVSSYGIRPQHLFDGVDKRLSIVLGQRNKKETPNVWTTRFNRWLADEYAFLFTARLIYSTPQEIFSVYPTSLEKIGSTVESTAFQKLSLETSRLKHEITRDDQNAVFYTRNFGYFLSFLDMVPRVFDKSSGEIRRPSELKVIGFQSPEAALAALAALNSTTFFWFCNVLSDCRNLNKREIEAFPFAPDAISLDERKRMTELGQRYLDHLMGTTGTLKKGNLSIQTFRYAETKTTIDEIDQVLAKCYGFTDEELDFIINYDIKYRMGKQST